MQLITGCDKCKLHDICSRREKIETYLDLVSNSVSTDGNGDSCDLPRTIHLGDSSDGIIFEMRCEYNPSRHYVAEKDVHEVRKLSVPPELTQVTCGCQGSLDSQSSVRPIYLYKNGALDANCIRYV